MSIHIGGTDSLRYQILINRKIKLEKSFYDLMSVVGKKVFKSDGNEGIGASDYWHYVVLVFMSLLFGYELFVFV